jgi:hypothetical protein
MPPAIAESPADERESARVMRQWHCIYLDEEAKPIDDMLSL